jgi:aspartyl-tRNA(Asn)/glutamyl-tRNA(Gln) amidotransferase subunit B
LAGAASVDVTEPVIALLVQRDQDALALAAIAAGADASRVLTHVEHDIPADASEGFDPGALARVVTLESDRKLTATQAKKVLEVIAERGGSADPAALAAELGFEAMESSELESLVDEAIAANADAWAKVVGGNDKAAGAITGHVMRATKGKADGKLVAEILASRKAAATV